MSGVDALSVIDRDALDAHAWRCAAQPELRASRDSKEAYEAFSELIDTSVAIMKACRNAKGHAMVLHMDLVGIGGLSERLEAALRRVKGGE